MAQTVQVPRFYTNELQWLDYTGHIPMPSEHFRTLPVNPIDYTEEVALAFSSTYLPNPYCAVLGHTDVGVEGFTFGDTAINPGGLLINAAAGDMFDGWSLMELNGSPTSFNASGKIGSVSIGSYWDAPHSPDLSVTLTYDYSGIKKINTKGGSTLVNAYYHAPPKWGSFGAWEIFRDARHALRRSGRRIWSISFSFFSESDIFPGSLNLATTDETNYDYDTVNTGTDDFYGNVIQRCAGPALPFIFSPDKTSDALDNFAICTFDQNSFSFQQTAPGLYSVKLKVVETW